MSSRDFRVLVMTDMVDSTALLHRLGDARWAVLLAEHREALRKVAWERGGEYLGHTGDGLLLSFTAPGPALRCAAELVETAQSLAVPVRVGVHAGEVEHVEDGVGGFAVHLTARVTCCAGAGEVFVSPAVVPLVAGGDLFFEDAGEHRVKGIATPWRLWRLRPPPPAPRRDGEREGLVGADDLRLPLPHPLGIVDLPFVGRRSQLADAVNAWQHVAGGGTTSLVVSGEPGVGKTRLVAELARVAHAEGAVVLFGRCDEGLRAPYQPVAEALAAFVRDVPAAALPVLLSADRGELARLVPTLSHTVVGARPAPAAVPEVEQHRLFTATAAWLEATGVHAPVVLVADDVHWGDEATLALLRHLARASVPRLLLVLTLRDTEPCTDHLGLLLSDVSREGHSRRIALGGLTTDDVADLVVGPQGVTDTLARETNGNPFFLGEVLRELVARGVAHRAGDVWVTSGPVSLDVPPGVREAVRRRVAVLDRRCLPVLTAAAVVGLEAHLLVVAAVAGLDEQEALTALEVAAAARLVHEVPELDRWRFAHALVRSALLEQVSAARRRRLHRDVVAAVERVPGVMSPADAATHAVAAGDTLAPEVTARYSENAARHAHAAAAPAQAFHFWQQAVEALQRDPAASATRLAELQARRAEAAVRAGVKDWDELAEQALRGALLAGDARLAAEAALVAANTWWNGSITTHGITRRGSRLLEALRMRGAADVLEPAGTAGVQLDVTGVRLQAALATELMWMPASLELRDRLSREALARARALGDPRALADAAGCRGTAVWCARTARERAELALEGESLARAQSDAYGLMNAAALLGISGIETAWPRLLELSAAASADAREGAGPTVAEYHVGLLEGGRRLLTDLGDVPEFFARLAQTGESVGHPDAALFHFFQMQYVALLRGVPSEHLDLLVVGFDAAPHFAGAPALAAALLVLAGRADEAPRLLAASAALVSESDNVLEGAAIGGLAIVSSLLRDEHGAKVALSAMERVDAACLGSGLVYVGATEHWRGACLSVLQQHDAAHQALIAGRAVHERLGATVGLAMSEAELARLRLAQGDRSGARRSAATARSYISASGAGLAEHQLQQAGL